MSQPNAHEEHDAPTMSAVEGNGRGPHEEGFAGAGAVNPLLQSFQEHPELALGAAFIGGLVVARLLRRVRS